MSDIDVVDSTWIGVRPCVLAPQIADPGNWRRWWPDLEVRVSEARGVKGVRWQVREARRGGFTAAMEIWLQPVADGTLAHFFLCLDLLGAGRRPRARRARLVRHYRRRAKRLCWELSDRLDPGRLARVAAPGRQL